LVQNSVTLNGVRSIISPNSVAFGTDYVKVVDVCAVLSSVCATTVDNSDV